ncbi:MAG: response regulator [Bacteroidota bacterium]|nr:response regulator [Bacteroidota bacterium]
MAEILIIEDETFLRNLIRKMLEMKGFTCYEASNGLEGIQMLAKLSPQLIICDVMMPLADGFEVLQHIKSNTSLQNIPFVFLTARADTVDKNRASEMGASGYLTKPFSITDLLSTVQSLLR